MKRAPQSPPPSAPSAKRARSSELFSPRKIATSQAAAAVDADPPLPRLLKAVEEGTKSPRKGECVVYWMRMGDLRVSDNRALSLASTHAKDNKIPLLVLFLFSPQDYVAHDRGARRIDFTLRNLAVLKTALGDLHIPLHTVTLSNRRAVPQDLMHILDHFGASAIYANIEYEIDELRRDIQVCEAAKSQGVSVVFVHDKCVVPPGVVLTKDNRSYAVYSPYQKVWLSKLNTNISHFLKKYEKPHSNPESIRTSAKFSRLFDSAVPESIPGFELDTQDRAKMEEVWPAGEETAREMLERFLHTKSRSSQLGAVDPLTPDAETSAKHSRLSVYDAERDRADKDTTSRLSPYLAAGVISARICIRALLSPDPNALPQGAKVDGGKTTAAGRWVQEVAWRDFYACILTGFPRVSMGRPFLEKYADVVWEGPDLEGAYEDRKKAKASRESQDRAKADENIEKWKSGCTGIPIVDAGMRCLNTMGWMHNRLRMICAMFLVKDLMVDWRVGERYFMEKLIDGDLASNNGGWQWSASTGVDPCPYFRIFNPYSQSTKADPSGDYIRKWIPELAQVRGPDVHNPSTATADRLGYPRPIVKHSEARERALRRFKNPGTA